MSFSEREISFFGLLNAQLIDLIDIKLIIVF